eukprot:5972472-Pyramimonas_sp.AAC.1
MCLVRRSFLEGYGLLAAAHVEVGRVLIRSCLVRANCVNVLVEAWAPCVARKDASAAVGHVVLHVVCVCGARRWIGTPCSHRCVRTSSSGGQTLGILSVGGDGCTGMATLAVGGHVMTAFVLGTAGAFAVE